MKGIVGAGLLWAIVAALGTSVRANCAVIDQLDKLHTIQARLANTPDTGLFMTDIRQLRAIMGDLSNRDALDAVEGNAIAGRGAQVVRFLTNTQDLLSSVSLDEPNRVRVHFTNRVRRNMDQISDHLTDLRCTRDQVNIAQAALTQTEGSGDSDAEDLADVMETLSRVSEELVKPRNILLIISLIGAGFLIVPLIRKWLILRKRRAKRHTTNYATQYRNDQITAAGSLLDINCFGTKLARAQDHVLEMGETVEVSVDDIWIKGTVVWSNTHYSGIMFRRAIDLSEVALVIAKSAKA